MRDCRASPGLLDSINDCGSTWDRLLLYPNGHFIGNIAGRLVLAYVARVNPHISRDRKAICLIEIGVRLGVSRCERSCEGLAVDLSGGIHEPVRRTIIRYQDWVFCVTSLLVLDRGRRAIVIRRIIKVSHWLSRGNRGVDDLERLFVVPSLDNVIALFHPPLPEVAVEPAARGHAPPSLNEVVIRHLFG